MRYLNFILAVSALLGGMSVICAEEKPVDSHYREKYTKPPKKHPIVKPDKKPSKHEKSVEETTDGLTPDEELIEEKFP